MSAGPQLQLAVLWPWLLMATLQAGLGHTGLALVAAVESERSAAQKAIIRVIPLKVEPVILEGEFANVAEVTPAEGKLLQLGGFAQDRRCITVEGIHTLQNLREKDIGIELDPVIQHRLRQIEASYKQEVEQLRRQVRELQLRLDIRHFCAPPAEPPMDYEDDFTCLKESDGSDTEDFCSDHSEDCLSEASWEPVDKKETEVTRWVPDHMASHCFNCDCEFWLAKRRHRCRNCGNVFCAGCCHLKLPIPDQQLYDPVLVCNSCYDHIQVSRARELMSQHLKKPIATASS